MSREGLLTAVNRAGTVRSGAVGATRLAVVFATDFDRASAGGVMTGLKELARNLSDRFRLIVFGVGDSRVGIPAHVYVDGLDLTFVPLMRMPPRHTRIPLNLIFTLRLFWARRDIERQADLILARRMESALPFIIGKRKPVILSVHNSSKDLEFDRIGVARWRLLRPVYRVVEGFVLSKVDRVVFVGRAAYDHYYARYPRLRHKFLQIPNCINLSKFSAADRAAARSRYGLRESDLVIVYAGRLHPEKQVDALIEAFSRISSERRSAYLLIAGEGPGESTLRKQVDRLGLSNVRFVGWLAREEVRILLSAADVSVLLSLREGFSNAVLEALACGVPVVAADAGGMRELLAGRLQRFIVSSFDPELVKNTILEAADQRLELTDACLRQAEQYDAKIIMPRLERLYASVIGPRE